MCEENENLSKDNIIEDGKSSKTPGNVNLSTVFQLVFFFLGWLGFQLLGLIFSLIYVKMMVPNGTDEENVPYNAAVTFSTYLILFTIFILIIFLLKPQEKNKFISKFKVAKNYYLGIIFGFCLIGLNFLLSLFSTYVLKATDNDNQNSLILMVNSYPFLSVLVLGFVGPICEELTYRVGLFNVISKKKRWLGYVIGMLIFGLIHFNFTATSQAEFINELKNIPTYIIAGAFLCYSYEKTSFVGSSVAHIMNNLFSVISILITRGQ